MTERLRAAETKSHPAAFLPSDARAINSRDRQEILLWRQRMGELKNRVKADRPANEISGFTPSTNSREQVSKPSRSHARLEPDVASSMEFKIKGVRPTQGALGRANAAMYGSSSRGNWKSLGSLDGAKSRSIQFSDIKAKIQMVSAYSMAPDNAAGLQSTAKPSPAESVGSSRESELKPGKSLVSDAPLLLPFLVQPAGAMPSPRLSYHSISNSLPYHKREKGKHVAGRHHRQNLGRVHVCQPSLDEILLSQPRHRGTMVTPSSASKDSSLSVTPQQPTADSCTQSSLSHQSMSHDREGPRSKMAGLPAGSGTVPLAMSPPPLPTAGWRAKTPKRARKRRLKPTGQGLPPSMLNICNESISVDERYDSYLRDLELEAGGRLITPLMHAPLDRRVLPETTLPQLPEATLPPVSETSAGLTTVNQSHEGEDARKRIADDDNVTLASGLPPVVTHPGVPSWENQDMSCTGAGYRVLPPIQGPV